MMQRGDDGGEEAGTSESTAAAARATPPPPASAPAPAPAREEASKAAQEEKEARFEGGDEGPQLRAPAGAEPATSVDLGLLPPPPRHEEEEEEREEEDEEAAEPRARREEAQEEQKAREQQQREEQEHQQQQPQQQQLQQQQQRPPPRPLAGRTVVVAGSEVTSALAAAVSMCGELGAARIVVAARSAKDAAAAGRRALAEREREAAAAGFSSSQGGPGAPLPLSPPRLEVCAAALDFCDPRSVRAFAAWARQGSFAGATVTLSPPSSSAAEGEAAGGEQQQQPQQQQQFARPPDAPPLPRAESDEVDVLVLMPPAASGALWSTAQRRAYEPSTGATALAQRLYLGPRLLAEELMMRGRRQWRPWEEGAAAAAPAGAEGAEQAETEEEEEEEKEEAAPAHPQPRHPRRCPYFPRVVVAASALHRLSSPPPAAPFLSEWSRGAAGPSAAAARALLAAELRERLAPGGVAVAMGEVADTTTGRAGRGRAAGVGGGTGGEEASAARGKGGLMTSSLPLALPPLLRPLQEWASGGRAGAAAPPDVSALAAAVAGPLPRAALQSAAAAAGPFAPGRRRRPPRHLPCFVPAASAPRLWSARAGRLGASAVGWLPLVGGTAAWALEAGAAAAGLAAEWALALGGGGKEEGGAAVAPAGSCADDLARARQLWLLSAALLGEEDEDEAGAAA